MAQENVTPLSQPAKLAENQGIIVGKITAVSQPRDSEYQYFTISGKAHDEYTLPPVVQVSQDASQRPMGREGDIVKVLVNLRGYPRKSGGNTYITNVFQFVQSLA